MKKKKIVTSLLEVGDRVRVKNRGEHIYTVHKRLGKREDFENGIFDKIKYLLMDPQGVLQGHKFYRCDLLKVTKKSNQTKER